MENWIDGRCWRYWIELIEFFNIFYKSMIWKIRNNPINSFKWRENCINLKETTFICQDNVGHRNERRTFSHFLRQHFQKEKTFFVHFFYKSMIRKIRNNPPVNFNSQNDCEKFKETAFESHVITNISKMAAIQTLKNPVALA